MKTNFKKLWMVFSLALLINFSCKKDPMGPDIYLAGFVYEEINQDITYHAAYWKNSRIVTLETSAVESEASALQVTNNKVYVAGRYDFGPCVWIDGQRKDLVHAPEKGNSQDIKVKGDLVYITGSKYTDLSGSNRAVLWIIGSDGQLKQHLLENERSSASNMVFDRETLLISGTYQDKPCYWKWTPASKSRVDLGIKQAHLSDIAVYENEVYIAGGYDIDNDGILPFSGGYWKGSTFYPLGYDWGNHSYLRSLAFDLTGQLYLSGRIHHGGGNYSAYYYKNGQQFTLSDDAVAGGMKIVNNDIYIAGNLSDRSIKDIRACYWKNGILHAMKTPQSVARNIEIVE